MRDELLEKILDVIALYLKLGEAKSTSLIKVKEEGNCTDERIFLREILWNKLLELLQQLHRL